MIENDSWWKFAACLAISDGKGGFLSAKERTDVFFPGGHHNPSIRKMNRAKDICATCDVCEECLASAMDEERDAITISGVRGCKTPDERIRLQRTWKW